MILLMRVSAVAAVHGMLIVVDGVGNSFSLVIALGGRGVGTFLYLHKVTPKAGRHAQVICEDTLYVRLRVASRHPHIVAKVQCLGEEVVILFTHALTAPDGTAAFVIAGSISLRYLIAVRKGSADERALGQMDYLSYRMVAFGFLFLTVVLLSGAIWAEQAWSAFWTWDPKEVWALITWLIYAVYLHLRLRMKKRGTAMAWFLVIAVPVVFFTFAGVNTLMHGLHTYG